MHRVKKFLFVAINMPLCLLGFIAAMVVGGYQVGAMVYNDLLDHLNRE
jgi:hypothetical protein